MALGKLSGWLHQQLADENGNVEFLLFGDSPASEFCAEVSEHSVPFYDRMTAHRNRFLVNKTNRCTEFQFYSYHDSTCFREPFCPSSGVFSRTSALVHFMQL